MSRALVHTYLGDRRGLIDAVQVRIVGRLDAWVGHGLRRADTPEARLRALVQGVCAFVVAEHDAWGVLGTSGGFDHPALHGVRARWAATLTDDEVRGQAVVAALVGGVGPWMARGVEPDDVERVLRELLP